jgi:hypothetical protein
MYKIGLGRGKHGRVGVGLAGGTGGAEEKAKLYLALRDTLCSCEAYGMKPMYEKKKKK